MQDTSAGAHLSRVRGWAVRAQHESQAWSPLPVQPPDRPGTAIGMLAHLSRALPAARSIPAARKTGKRRPRIYLTSEIQDLGCTETIGLAIGALGATFCGRRRRRRRGASHTPAAAAPLPFPAVRAMATIKGGTVPGEMHKVTFGNNLPGYVCGDKGAPAVIVLQMSQDARSCDVNLKPWKLEQCYRQCSAAWHMLDCMHGLACTSQQAPVHCNQTSPFVSFYPCTSGGASCPQSLTTRCG